MAVFLDTGFILALKNEDDKNHENAQSLMRDFLLNKYGTIYFNAFIYNEIVTLASVRIRNFDFTLNVATYLHKTDHLTMLWLLREDFLNAKELFLKHAKRGLTFTDCTILAQCNRVNCKFLATYDSHFDGLLETKFKSE